MRLHSVLAALLAVAAAGASLALAQTAPAPAAMPTIPPLNCVVPDYPGWLASDPRGSEARIKAFNRDYAAYGECIKKYVADAKAASKAAIEAGNKALEQAKAASNAAIEAGNKAAEQAKATSDAAIEAGNKAVEQYNKYSDELKKQVDAGK